MWPDDDRLAPFPTGDTLEPDLAALDADLARAGRVAADTAPRPSASFERDLRARLVGLPAAVGTVGGATANGEAAWAPDGALQPLAPRVGRRDRGHRSGRSGGRPFDRTR